MFKVGQKVVCKSTSSNNGYYPTGIKRGEIYTVEYISKCICGKELLHLKEPPKLGKWCGLLHTYIGIDSSYHSNRFEPVVDNFAENLLERLTKEYLEEQKIIIVI